MPHDAEELQGKLQQNMSILSHNNTYRNEALGDLMVSVLATGPKFRGFKPSRGRWILRVIKSVATPSEGK
jgi:hypothetical protein